MSRGIDVRKDVVPGQGSTADINLNKLPKRWSITASPAPDLPRRLLRRLRGFPRPQCPSLNNKHNNLQSPTPRPLLPPLLFFIFCRCWRV